MGTTWWLFIGWGIQDGETFDLTINLVQGTNLQVAGLAESPYRPNTPITFDVAWSLDAPLAANGEAFGLLLLGPPGAEGAVQIPVRLHNVVSSYETVNIVAQKDARLFSGMPTTNYGASPYLYVGANDSSRSLLQFDLSDINPTYGVESAKLRLYIDAFGGGGTPADLAAYRLTTPWDKSAVTWNKPWTKKGGDFVEPAVTAPITKLDVGKFVELDVTAWAHDWLTNPAADNGVILRLINQTSVSYYRLTSGENWDPTQAPVLVLTLGKP